MVIVYNMELPNEIKSKTFLFLSHPCADIIKGLYREIMTNTYYGIDEYQVHKSLDMFLASDSFVEHWHEWHFMNQGELIEKQQFIQKNELSDDENY